MAAFAPYRETVPVTLNLDADTAEEAEAILQELGLDLPTAISIFLHQVARDGGIPFTPSLNWKISQAV